MTCRAHILSTLCVTIGTGLVGVETRAMSPDFPTQAVLSAEAQDPVNSYNLPIGPWSGGLESLNFEGVVTRQAWQLPSSDLTSLQIYDPLRSQIEALGYHVLFECETLGCGGFDFRYATDIFPEPQMHVNLGDFRFLAAHNPDAGKALSLLVSRSRETGFVQLIRVGPGGEAEPQISASAKNPEATDWIDTAPEAGPTLESASRTDIAGQLENLGRATLDDLVFETGGATLDGGPFLSLSALADYLKRNPERHVTLVGHTDAVGSLDENIALSRLRARAVQDYLVKQLEASTTQLGAEGMGYLAPRASNLTAEGREANRRVEVMLTTTQ